VFVDLGVPAGKIGELLAEFEGARGQILIAEHKRRKHAATDTRSDVLSLANDGDAVAA
jgi:hypothetical protein